MDEADIASGHEQRQREEAQKRRKQVVEHDGYCLNCGAESAGAYCDQFCREDAERFDKARIRNGC